MAGMTVRRIVANLATADPAVASRFYHDVLGLGVMMDLGWIVTYGAPATMTVQLSVAREGGSGTSVPDLSVEVDDVDAVLLRVQQAGFAVEYGPVDEPWGVRDPLGRLVNILAHRATAAA
jgi:catechol 2,3-dioxygenase-like lactoylglutathione lyase family enzyme